MGAILDLVDYIATPFGVIMTVAVGSGVYYFVRWVLRD